MGGVHVGFGQSLSFVATAVAPAGGLHRRRRQVPRPSGLQGAAVHQSQQVPRPMAAALPASLLFAIYLPPSGCPVTIPCGTALFLLLSLHLNGHWTRGKLLHDLL